LEVNLIRLLTFQNDGSIINNHSIQEINELSPIQEGFFWMDIYEEPFDKIRALLTDYFHFDSLAIDDALDQIHVPKIDDWENYLYLTLHSPTQSETDYTVSMPEIDVFLGANFLVTYHDTKNSILDSVWAISSHTQRINKKGSVGLLYLVADNLINGFMTIIDRLDENIEQVEDELFNEPKQSLLQEIFHIKRSLLTLRRIIAPTREVMNKLSRGDYALIPAPNRMLFRDLYDHLVRLHDILENLRELLGEAMDTYLSVLNNRMNEIMRTLTVITTFFMPLTFITGFFGMNYFQPVADLSAWTSKMAFIALLIGIVLFPWLMFRWMRSKRWM
jgi:magnesium transporter